MTTASFTITSSEQRTKRIDYSQFLSEDETLVSVLSVSVDPVTSPPLVASAAIVLPDAVEVDLSFGDGLSPTDYEIKLLVSTSNGQRHESCYHITVEDSDCG
jgi:hypothetical protein